METETALPSILTGSDASTGRSYVSDFIAIGLAVLALGLALWSMRLARKASKIWAKQVTFWDEQAAFWDSVAKRLTPEALTDGEDARERNDRNRD
jgi:hypothetical protein